MSYYLAWISWRYWLQQASTAFSCDSSIWFLYNNLQFHYNNSRCGNKQHSRGIKACDVTYKITSWRPSKISFMSIIISDSSSVKLSMDFSSKRAWRLCIIFFLEVGNIKHFNSTVLWNSVCKLLDSKSLPWRFFLCYTRRSIPISYIDVYRVKRCSDAYHREGSDICILTLNKRLTDVDSRLESSVLW
jgi:hypothetical protein